MNRNWISAAIVAASSVVTGVASAQESAPPSDASEQRARSLEPATHAVELTIGTGYAQGFGNVGSGQPTLTDMATAGGALQLGVGYRLIPQLTLAVYGSGAVFGRGDQVDTSAKLYTAAAGVQADWHFLPARSEFDPWVSLGSGWRGYWNSMDQGTASFQGIELAKAQVGVDYRVTSAVSISPVIGADMSVFLTQQAAGEGAWHNVSNPNVNTFLFGGLLGRFDVPTESRSSRVASQ
jgi:outer membrane protein W